MGEKIVRRNKSVKNRRIVIKDMCFKNSMFWILKVKQAIRNLFFNPLSELVCVKSSIFFSGLKLLIDVNC